jgi:hypothetical protein
MRHFVFIDHYWNRPYHHIDMEYTFANHSSQAYLPDRSCHSPSVYSCSYQHSWFNIFHNYNINFDIKLILSSYNIFEHKKKIKNKPI